MRNLVPVILVLCLLLFNGCKKEDPNIIPKEKMIELLVDIHKSEAVVTLNHSKFSTEGKKRSLREAVLMHHNVSQEQFDRTLEYYSYNIEEYMEIYECVIDRLKQENEYIKMMIARENTQTLTADGDTIDIWKQDRSHIFNPYTGDNILSFNITKDDNFRNKDHFTLRFHAVNTPRYNPAKAYFAIRHNQQNIHYNYMTIERDGWHTLHLQSDLTTTMNEIYGYIAMPLQPYRHIMYIDSIELIRIHDNPEITPAEYNVIETQLGRIKKREGFEDIDREEKKDRKKEEKKTSIKRANNTIEHPDLE